MVRIQGPSEYERLDALVKEACEKHDVVLREAGWTRKTYDIHIDEGMQKGVRRQPLVARIESFATTSGEIAVYDDRALPFAETLGGLLEKEFDIDEAVILRKAEPDS